MTEWADEYRFLSSESSAEPGKYYSNRARYQIGIMDAVADRTVQEVVLKASSQIGKTEILNNIVGYFIHHDPSPILFVQPTLEVAEAWSKDRLDPMIRDCPILQECFTANSRDAQNTIRHKKFPGGHITIGGANSPASLASRPIRVVIQDEVDRYPHSAGDEGSPCELADKRSTTFWNRKLIKASTPTKKGSSEISNRYESSDKRIYYMPCPHCNEMISFEWQHLKFGDNKENPVYVCYKNGCIIEHSDKFYMLQKGEWKASKEFNGIVGFYINEMYSPWVTWAEMVNKFLRVKHKPDMLKTFVNTSLAQEWDEDYLHGKDSDLKAESLIRRCESYRAVCPKGVYLLTCGVDVQNDRLELEILGWGLKDENWSIDYIVLHGDPAKTDLWHRLDDVLEDSYAHELGIELKIVSTCIDTGGHHTNSVYNYCAFKKRQKKNVHAIKGSSTYNVPVVYKYSKVKNYKIRLYIIGTDSAKDIIYSRLKIEEHGDGYCHFPDHYTEQYFSMLIAERKIERYERGQTRTRWECPRGRRNEALDCRVYNMAAYKIIKPNIAKVKLRFDALVAKNNGTPLVKNMDNEGESTRERLLRLKQQRSK